VLIIVNRFKQGKIRMADPNQKVSPQLQQFIMQEQAKAQVRYVQPFHFQVLGISLSLLIF
jgi:hypothetical protein